MISSNNIIVFICLIVISSCKLGTNFKDYSSDKIELSQNAMVVSAHPLASDVGVQVLKSGGNAIDAAIAVQFALAVVYPVAGNIGGGGFMVIRMEDGTVAALDYREMAPTLAHRDMYLDETGNVIQNLSTKGHLAVGVPGAVDGMVKAYERFGETSSFGKLLDGAIALAEDGFEITAQEARALNSRKSVFKQVNNTKNAFIKKSEWQEGDILRQKDLAKTLQRIQAFGRAGFYEGETADKIVAEMRSGGGIISHNDLKNYQAKWRKPIQTDYKQYEVIGMPPPSSGGVALAQLLEMVERADLSQYGFQSREAIHLMVEAERRVYADRAEYLGDPDFVDVPLKGLLDKYYLKRRMMDFNPNQATNSEDISAGTVPMYKESEETTHFSIVDQHGNAVSVTTTLNTGYGSKVVVAGAGFFLNNEMDDFSSKPGVPNVYGLVGNKANAISPGKRMLSSMTPTIILENGQLKMVVGTPGGSTIITSVFQVILNHLEFGLDLEKSVHAPRFHHQWLPDRISFEKGALSPDVMNSLKSMGHQLHERGSIGRVEAIVVLDDGSLKGVADIRGDDDAEGF